VTKNAILDTATNQLPLEPKKKKWHSMKGHKGIASQPVEKIYILDNKYLGSTTSEGLHRQWRSYHIVGEPIRPPYFACTLPIEMRILHDTILIREKFALS
jgi:hypothetical protein